MNAATHPSMFEERSEHAYFLDAEHAQTFVDRVGEHLDIHWFHHPGAQHEPAHYVTTLYFDSDAREIAQACETGSESVRLRARQYCDSDPELGLRREPLLWIEVKTRSGASTRKVRFAIPSHDVHTFLRDGVITERMLEFQRQAWGRPAEAVLGEISELCTHTVGPLKPDCLAHYRRRAWQDAGETLRITLDTELGFHRAPANLFQAGMTLSDAVTGPPAAQLRSNLVEIKLRTDPPDWLRELILDLGLEPALEGGRVFSKFVAASHAVHPTRAPAR